MADARSISQEDVHESSMTNGASGEDKALHNRQTCVRKEMVHLGKIRHCMSDKRACAWNLCHALYMRLLRHTVQIIRALASWTRSSVLQPGQSSLLAIIFACLVVTGLLPALADLFSGVCMFCFLQDRLHDLLHAVAADHGLHGKV